MLNGSLDKDAHNRIPLLKDDDFLSTLISTKAAKLIQPNKFSFGIVVANFDNHKGPTLQYQKNCDSFGELNGIESILISSIFQNSRVGFTLATFDTVLQGRIFVLIRYNSWPDSNNERNVSIVSVGIISTFIPPLASIYHILKEQPEKFALDSSLLDNFFSICQQEINVAIPNPLLSEVNVFSPGITRRMVQSLLLSQSVVICSSQNPFDLSILVYQIAVVTNTKPLFILSHFDVPIISTIKEPFIAFTNDRTLAMEISNACSGAIYVSSEVYQPTITLKGGLISELENSVNEHFTEKLHSQNKNNSQSMINLTQIYLKQILDLSQSHTKIKFSDVRELYNWDKTDYFVFKCLCREHELEVEFFCFDCCC
eukprot:TRINITY_DN2398_c0_g3_i1.p1 TRINITY_DN2398_c0_g3~~TRINITY_DN2398_c0_g3_i1.p1  ORF type:complete len:379 (-),score=87.48 TRINITY_DN2398_c0_g3_i1:38-1147(-)